MPDSHQGSPLETRVGRLETGMEFLRGEVHNVAKGVDSLSQNLGTQIADLGKQFSSSGKTNWVVISTFASLAVVIFGAFWQISKSPLEAALVRQQDTIHELKSDGVEARRDITSRLKEVASSIVPRSEHERIWREGDRRLDDLERSIREMRQNNVGYVTKELDRLKGNQ